MEALVGCFMNLLPFRLDLAQDPTFEELLERACSAAAGAYAHQQAPVHKIMSDLHGSGSGRFEAPFPVLLQSRTYRGAEELSAGPLRIERYEFDPGTPAAELSISFTKSSAGLICEFDYRADCFNDDTIHSMTRCYLDLLAACVSSPGKHLSELASIVSAPQLTQSFDGHR